MRALLMTLLVGSLFATSITAHAQMPRFEHVVVIVQENRTPDNLFQALCDTPEACSPNPGISQYNIQTHNWLDKTQSTGVIQPLSIPLASHFDLLHSHTAFVKQCDLDSKTGKCAMDGAALVPCGHGACPAQAAFRFVDNSTGILNPYLMLAREYGWANYMFQTNQGPSFPAHQFIFGGTSAPSAADDAAGVFVAENPLGTGEVAGCNAPAGTEVRLISPPDVEGDSFIPASSTTQFRMCSRPWTGDITLLRRVPSGPHPMPFDIFASQTSQPAEPVKARIGWITSISNPPTF